MEDDDESAEGFGFEAIPAGDANANAGGGNAPPPPAYVETPQVIKKLDMSKEAVAAKLSHNFASSMAQEDIRTRLADHGIGYVTKFGKGPLGGKTGAVKGSRDQVTQPISKARPTLITQQPGQPRSTNGVGFNHGRSGHCMLPP